MFDVRRSSFKTTPFGINATCERLQNNLARMGWVSVPAREVNAVINWREVVQPLISEQKAVGIREWIRETE